MNLILDSADGALTDFQHTDVPNGYVRLSPDDEYTARYDDAGTAGSFAEIIDSLSESKPCWVVCWFATVDQKGNPCVEPLILTWAPPSIRAAVGARMVLGARDIARLFPQPPIQIFMSRRMSAEDIAQYIRYPIERPT
ncbi:hypothetical protein [Nocardia noduli]|uniref:hypothetical protein n=1 Tax=Nocardia noduli TaxID=2815722 RepID=UPI001C245BB0|nr:hypothetical protein [Nocardia noduli]